jgi:coiled-coil domain-containing protein 39
MLFEQSTSIVLNAKIMQLEKDFSKQEEAVYNADFKLQQAEFLVSRGLGERSDQEKRELQQRIQELEQETNSLEDVIKALTTKKRQVEKEITLWQRKSDVSSKRIHEYESEKAELELEISSCESSLLKLENTKDEEMVSHDLVRMEVHRLRDILKDKTVSIHNLQQERNQLEESFKESKNDLNFSIDLQVVAMRAAEEERHKSAIELSQRKMATEKLQSKYDTLRIAHRSDEDTNGENSQVFYLISAAQKRADLQREGDQLDSEIQQKEKELSTLKSTLSNIKGQNSALRKSFMKVNPDSHEYKNMSELEEKVKDGYNSLLTNKKQLYSLQKACDSIGRQLKDLDARNLKILKENGCLIDSKKQIDSEIERLLNDEKNALKSIKVQIEMIDPSQKDHLAVIEVQVKEKFADMILMMLLELGKEFPTMNVSIITCLTTCGLEMPQEE